MIARPLALLTAAATLSLLVVLLVPQSSPGFNFLQPEYKWPGRPATIKYFNSVKKREAAIDDAARAWNGSGIQARFRQTGSKRRADLVIRADGQAQCGNGFALTQLTSSDGKNFEPTSATIDIGTGGAPKECRYIDVITTAHEMGHVLGLDHEDRRCALMNSSSFGIISPEGGPTSVSPAACNERLDEGTWFCRILTADDLKGAKRIYGGKPRVTNPEFCPFPSGPEPSRGEGAPLETVTLPFESSVSGRSRLSLRESTR